MEQRKNSLGQPIGQPLVDWHPVPRPPKERISGAYCQIEPIDADAHAADLFEAFSGDRDGRIWTYLPYGPMASEQDLRGWIETSCLGDDPMFHAIVDRKTAKAVGVASYLRIQPQVGVIEVGHINFSPSLQKTAAASEAMYLMMHRVFSQLGYRRYEWKCDALNAPSRRAALRLGFQFDGIFEQATIYKSRNRDTAWYSILDKDWPMLQRAYESWLDPQNFDDRGRQKDDLATMITRSRKRA